MVDDGEDGVLSISWWKSCDKIHSNMLKRSCTCFCAYAIKGSFLLMCEDLVLLADCTSFDIFCDPLSGSRPMILFCNSSGSLVSSRVSCCGNVMPDIHDFSADVVIRWDH